MNKILRYSLMLMVAMLSTVSYAQTKVDFTASTITVTDDGFTLTASGFTFEALKNDGATKPTQNGSSKDLRIYAKNTFKVSGGSMTTMTFTMSNQGKKRWADITPSTGTVTINTDAGTTTWTSSSAVSEVTFTVGDKATHGTEGATKAGQFDVNDVTINGGGSTPPAKPDETVVDNIANFNAASVDDVVSLTLKDVVVLYSWTSNNGNNSTYIRDASGALLLYNCGLNLKAGDILNGSVVLKRSAYNNTIQGQKVDKTNKDNITVTDGDEPVAKTILYADAKDNVSDLVVIRDVDIVEDNNRFYIGTGTDRLQVYNGFYISEYKVAAAFYVNVTGIITRYKDTYEIYPIEDPSTTTGINGVKTVDNDKDAPVYNLAGQRVSKDYKGVVIQNGKKRINK